MQLMFTEAVMQRNKEITQKQVCDYVARSVKASPHQRGGDKYKVFKRIQ